MHILILTDRDWLHPQTGGTGVHLTGQIDHWLAWGHRVTVIAGGFPGAREVEREGRLTVYRTGSRTTVFPRTIARGVASRIPRADVTLEVINGICWMTPLWHRGPRVALVHHVHKAMYADEMGLKGRVAASALETLPLRHLYRGSRFVVVSEATKAEVAQTHRIPRASIDVVHPGVDSEVFHPAAKTAVPTMVFLGRLKAYKRVEVVLDVVDRIDGLSLDIVGDGDYGPELRRIVAQRGLGDRVRFHGHADDDVKRRLLSASWLAATASSAEGWSSSTMEAAASGTPTVAHPIGGLKESIVDGETGVHAETTDDFVAAVQRLVADRAYRERLSAQARARACTLGWERSARSILEILQAAANGGPVAASDPRDSGPRSADAPPAHSAV